MEPGHEGEIEEEEEATFIAQDEVAEALIPDAGAPLADEEQMEDEGDNNNDDDENDDDEDGMDDGNGGNYPPPSRDDSVLRFKTHTEAVYAVALHPSRPIAVSGGGDDKAYLWDVNTGNPIFNLFGHTDSINCIRFSNDGRFVATGGLDAEVRVWDTSSGNLVVALTGPSESIEWIEWHSRANIIAAGDGDGSVWLWNPTLAEPCMGVFAGHAGGVLCGGFTYDGKLLYSAGEDGTVRLWSPNNQSGLHTFQGVHTDSVTCACVSTTHPVILTGSNDKTAVFLNSDTRKVLGKLSNLPDAVECVSLCQELPIAVTACLNGSIQVWDTNSFQMRCTFSQQVPAHPEQKKYNNQRTTPMTPKLTSPLGMRDPCSFYRRRSTR
eukprot:c14104_g1_i3.p1 GENE.c14104_g1_i3~~c14104_g1_i3.p1  ORF type:complete len:395 (+),score=87.31 c14104_g1_i3:46-1185(+)